MVTAPKSGAEVIPFLKTYVNLPAAIACTTLYVKLTESMKLSNVFYAFTIPFLTFFASFPILIYPNHHLLHPHEFIDILAGRLHKGFTAPLAIARNWSFSIFYVLAEMWGSVVTSLLFWGFANQVTTVPEAKKYCKYIVAPYSGSAVVLFFSSSCTFCVWRANVFSFCVFSPFAFLPSFLSVPLSPFSHRSIIWSWCKLCVDRIWTIYEMGW